MRTSFPLDKPAGNLARGVGLFFVLNRQREKREWALVVTDRDRRQHHCVAELNEGGPGRLLCHAAGLDDQLATRKGPLDAMHHLLYFLVRTQIAREALLPPRDMMAWSGLIPETKVLNERTVLRDVFALQILEQSLALADHLEETATPVVVLGVGTEVTLQVKDALREQRNLNAGGTGVPFVGPVLVNRGCLIERHRRKFLGAFEAQGTSAAPRFCAQLYEAREFIPPRPFCKGLLRA